MDSVLRPRDIQARIRAGETPEDVAAAARTTTDEIMAFATPVLAERAYQAQLAQRASVRRRTAGGQVGTLGSAVTSGLEALGVDSDSVEWDAWRREDGRWTVVASYAAGDEHHQAAFAYDAPGRFVVAEDDQARALVGERTVAAVDEPSLAPPEQAPVGAALDDLLVPREPSTGEQQPLGDDAISLVTGHRPSSATESRTEPERVGEPVAQLQGEATLDLTDTAAAVRTAGPPPTRGADWITTQASERPVPSTRPAPQPVQPQGAEGDAREAEREAMTLFEVPGPAESSAEEAADPAPRPARASRSRGRASVPSWDEIVFGAPKSD